MQEAIEQRGDGGGVTEQLAPIVHRSVGREQRRSAFVPTHDNFQQIFGRGVRQLAHAQVIDLCAAPHKSTNATPAVMWSEAAPISQTPSASPILTPHYWDSVTTTRAIPGS